MKDKFDLRDEINWKIHTPLTPFNADDFNVEQVFLSGASGFVGSFLLKQILQDTQAKIHCLVRAPDETSGLEHLQQPLQHYNAWETTYQKRIIPVLGDLVQPRLGLTEIAFEQLAKTCDVIIHNGAQVNFMRPYATLKPANVDGTKQIIQLAVQHKIKPVHFISSIAVFFSPAYATALPIQENQYPQYDPAMQGGYKQSKWVAEQLLLQARTQGLPVNIYRLPRVWGDSQTGISLHFNDLLCRLLKACFALKAYPIMETTLNLVPVDYVSQALTFFIQQPAYLNQTLHLCNPQSIHWNTFFSEIEALGYPLQPVSYSTWLEKLQLLSQSPSHDKFYSGLLLALKFPNYLISAKPEFATEQATAFLQTRSICCPTINRQLIQKYIQDQNFGKFLLG